MYKTFHCFADDAQKIYWSVIASLNVALFELGCYVDFSPGRGKYPSERERLKMTAYGCT